MASERDFEDVLVRYPEMIEEGLRLIGRQVDVCGRRIDLLFEDRFKQKLVVELKWGPIKDEHVGQIMYYQGALLSGREPVRTMLVGNRVPPAIQKSLDFNGLASKEIRLSTLIEFLRAKGETDLVRPFEADLSLSDAALKPKAPNRVAIRTAVQPAAGKHMDAILFSGKPTIVVVGDAIRHLEGHEELYWEVGFGIARERFSYPMYGFIHIGGGRVEHRVSIRDIVPFSPDHYENKSLAERVKPEAWLRDWRENRNDCRAHRWRNALVMTEIEHFPYDTCSFQKCDGTQVKRPPQGFMHVLLPG